MYSLKVWNKPNSQFPAAKENIMMQRTAFEARRISLENAFFQNRDAELVASLRQELSRMEDKLQLTKVSGILNEKVLKDLVQVGVRAETLMAMRLVPMVAVAWTDRILSREERLAILKAAAEEDIVSGSAAYGLLSAWLERPPDERIITAWREYVTEVVRIMPPDSLKELRERTARLCQVVAKATGGVLGIKAISAKEKAAIDEFVGAFDQKSAVA